MGYTLQKTLRRPYAQALADVRAALAGQGFGILTEIDLTSTLMAKLDIDVAPETILGACRPDLAYQALQVEPSIAAVLPCNVVVRSIDSETTVVEAFDPSTMARLVDAPGVGKVAAEANDRLTAAFTTL